ncbi:MAG: response regulator [bacterium]|nr:response regulator [bacterium]
MDAKDKRATQELVAASRNDSSGWVVLIVDDEGDNLRVIARLLSFLGAEVHTASGGYEALDVLKRVTPTFILSDLSMPQMNGWSLFERIRANSETKHIPIIAITAHGFWGSKKSVMASGFDGYISKPFGISTFLLEIQRCLSSTGAGV